MSGGEFALLCLAWMLAGASPGPSTLAISGVSMRHGRRAGLALSLGVVTGSAVWGLAAALGLGAVMLTHVWLAEALRIVAGAYLVYLAIKSLRSAFRTRLTKAEVEVPRGQMYRRGLMIHLTNPKAIFAWGAVFAVAVPADAPLRDVALTGGVLIVLSFFLFTGYALLFSSRRAVALYARAGRWIEGTFGVLFGAAGGRILVGSL